MAIVNCLLLKRSNQTFGLCRKFARHVEGPKWANWGELTRWTVIVCGFFAGWAVWLTRYAIIWPQSSSRYKCPFASLPNLMKQAVDKNSCSKVDFPQTACGPFVVAHNMHAAGRLSAFEYGVCQE